MRGYTLLIIGLIALAGLGGLAEIIGTGSEAWAITPSSGAYAQYNYRAVGAIQGHCTVLASIGNSLPSACKGVTLILKSETGEELERVKTSDQGSFKFKAQNGVKYTIICDPESCEIASPKGIVHGGDLLDLKVEAKH